MILWEPGEEVRPFFVAYGIGPAAPFLFGGNPGTARLRIEPPGVPPWEYLVGIMFDQAILTANLWLNDQLLSERFGQPVSVIQPYRVRLPRGQIASLRADGTGDPNIPGGITKITMTAWFSRRLPPNQEC